MASPTPVVLPPSRCSLLMALVIKTTPVLVGLPTPDPGWLHTLARRVSTPSMSQTVHLCTCSPSVVCVSVGLALFPVLLPPSAFGSSVSLWNGTSPPLLFLSYFLS